PSGAQRAGGPGRVAYHPGFTRHASGGSQPTMAKLPSIAARDWSTQPPYIHPGYRSTPLRGPKKKLIPLAHSLSELSQPVYGHDQIGELDHDLTMNARVNGEPLGERIVVAGRVLDERGRPVRNTLVELWQCNAAGR